MSEQDLPNNTPSDQATYWNEDGGRRWVANIARVERMLQPLADELLALAAPASGERALDVGCGGGLITEPMARLGASVTGIDAGLENIKTAAVHAQSVSLTIDYRCQSAEELAEAGTQYDAVLALEIIEHVANPEVFYDALCALVKPGGILILSTLNRTFKSYALAIIGVEYLLRWVPRGTHRWEKFVRPSEMADMLSKRGLTIGTVNGIVFQPVRGDFRLNAKDRDVNYIMAAHKAV